METLVVGRTVEGSSKLAGNQTQVVELKTFEEKRGFKGSRKIDNKTYQVQCGCIDNYNKQNRKAKTKPVLVEKGSNLCKVCFYMPWIVMDRSKGMTRLEKKS